METGHKQKNSEPWNDSTVGILQTPDLKVNFTLNFLHWSRRRLKKLTKFFLTKFWFRLDKFHLRLFRSGNRRKSTKQITTTEHCQVSTLWRKSSDSPRRIVLSSRLLRKSWQIYIFGCFVRCFLHDGYNLLKPLLSSIVTRPFSVVHKGLQAIPAEEKMYSGYCCYAINRGRSGEQ